ncbi:MAG TPA: hypothetical protein VFM05_05650, partial [Candidatus Saccharimonadales bacterium]|nr:hypothetical protein [Candidatus Saccharimonadales bacterium]
MLDLLEPIYMVGFLHVGEKEVVKDTGKAKKRLVKKTETVREKAERTSAEATSKQPRRLHTTTNKVSVPLRAF